MRLRDTAGNPADDLSPWPCVRLTVGSAGIMKTLMPEYLG